MKSRIIPSDKSVFEPFTIEVVIESEEDLADLWHRLNLGSHAVNETSDEISSTWKASAAAYPMWEQLDDIARTRGFIE